MLQIQAEPYLLEPNARYGDGYSRRFTGVGLKAVLDFDGVGNKPPCLKLKDSTVASCGGLPLEVYRGGRTSMTLLSTSNCVAAHFSKLEFERLPEGVQAFRISDGSADIVVEVDLFSPRPLRVTPPSGPLRAGDVVEAEYLFASDVLPTSAYGLLEDDTYARATVDGRRIRVEVPQRAKPGRHELRITARGKRCLSGARMSCAAERGPCQRAQWSPSPWRPNHREAPCALHFLLRGAPRRPAECQQSCYGPRSSSMMNESPSERFGCSCKAWIAAITLT